MRSLRDAFLGKPSGAGLLFLVMREWHALKLFEFWRLPLVLITSSVRSQSVKVLPDGKWQRALRSAIDDGAKVSFKPARAFVSQSFKQAELCLSRGT